MLLNFVIIKAIIGLIERQAGNLASVISRLKKSYKIPYTLDKHFGDSPVQIITKNGTRLGPSDLTARPFFMVAISVMAYVWTIFSSSWSTIFWEGSWPGRILVTLGYVGLIYFSLREISIPGQYGYNTVLPFIDYITNSKDKLIRTGNEQPYLPVSNFIGMREPDESGHLIFNDGSRMGQLFQITGSASNNTFEIDRETAVADFNDFLWQMPNDAIISFVTNTGGQNVNAQMTHLLDLFDRESDALIQSYITEEIKELYDYVQDRFITLHQYMLIIGDDPAAFKNAFNVVREFADRNGLVLSSITIPSKKHNYAFFKAIYGGVQDQVVLNNRLKKFKEEYPAKSGLRTAGSLTPTQKNKYVSNKKRSSRKRGVILGQKQKQTAVTPTKDNANTKIKFKRR